MKKRVIGAAAALLLLLLFAVAVFAEEPPHEHIPSSEIVISDIIESTCASGGSYKESIVCEICGAVLESKTVKVLITPRHTPGEAVVENKVPSTCAAEGSYESVIYCTVCGTELQRVVKIIPKQYLHRSEYNQTRTVVEKEDGCYLTFEDKTCPDMKKASLDLSALVGRTFAPGEYFSGDGSKRTCADGEERCALCGELLNPAIPHVWDNGDWGSPSGSYPWSSGWVCHCLLCGAANEPYCHRQMQYPYGDVNGDYEVTAEDARLALRAAVQLEAYDPVSRAFYCADYDGDGKISAEDARSILQTAVNMKRTRWVGGDLSPVWNDVDYTSADARYVLRYSVGLGNYDNVITENNWQVDIDEDGKITPADARLILRLSVGLQI